MEATAPVHDHRSCANHPAREAVARCPECARFYCRECIVEHDFRMVCAGCLAAMAGERGAGERGWGKARWRRVPVWPVLQALVGFAAVWVLFYLAAQILIDLPSNFHEGIYLERALEAMKGGA